MRLVGLVVLLAGCRQIFGFESPTVVDGAADGVVVPDASICAEAGSTCVGDVLRVCEAAGESPVDSTCSWGCVEGEPRCGALDPTGGVVDTSDLVADPLLLDQTINGTVTIDTSSGAMGAVRPAGSGVINGIGFEVRAGIGIFRFKSVVFGGTMLLVGTLPAAFVADGAITVGGSVDARGSCATNNAGPGGGQGGGPSTDGQGTGRGRRGTSAGSSDVSGGGGGGFGAPGSKGGDGGPIGNVPGGAGGPTFGDFQILSLVGGSGGGGGGRGGDGGVGGGGGGAVYLASNTSIAIAGGINAGGCGGSPAENSLGGGGGGGSGGSILLEAPTVVVDGQLGVLGGGGGPAGTGSAGEDAPLTGAASGGISDVDGRGGNGGSSAALSGTPGQNDGRAGGGGGSVGRIRINTRSGTVGGVGSTSPPLDSGGSTATSGSATVK